jgi:hypothetical protein
MQMQTDIARYVNRFGQNVYRHLTTTFCGNNKAAAKRFCAIVVGR